MFVGSEQVLALHEEHFKPIREHFHVDENFLQNQFDFAKLDAGGGKGGDRMACSINKQWFVKELNDGDYSSIVAEGFLAHYRAHICAGHSRITRIVLVFYRKGPGSKGERFLVMANCLPGEDVHMLYDLKGTADDKTLISGGKTIDQAHKRFFNLSMICGESCNCFDTCGVSEERRQYLASKIDAFEVPFPVLATARSELLSELAADVVFLQKKGLMDYSLIVGVMLQTENKDKTCPSSVLLGSQVVPHIVGTFDGAPARYYVGVIDILQRWVVGKRVAHNIKICFAPQPMSTVDPIRYGDQFLAHFVKKFVPMEAGEPELPSPVAQWWLRQISLREAIERFRNRQA